MTKQLALETSSQNMILPDEGQIRAMNSNTSLDFGTLYSKASRLWHKFPAWDAQAILGCISDIYRS